LPARWRQQAAADHLRKEAVALVDKQFGRARSDLQRRLEVSHRDLEREVTSRLTEQHEGLATALIAATHLRSRTTDEQQAHVQDLDQQLDALRRLLERLHDVR
jgi:ABC-type molybdenum transport system ATPase subunit/photorepair protein PhrA